jgi:TRAP-type C4-dicarboxylate transport system substrate-binding protein
MNGASRALAMLALAAFAASGCTWAASEKSGAIGDPVVLVLANSDLDTTGIPAVQNFVDRLADLSDGRVTVTIKSLWGGTRDDEPKLIRDVAAGRADLGWVGTRALDLVGVQAFRPLHAPFLVTSLAAEAAIIKDPLAKSLLGSLVSAGVVGLALMADQIRRPVGVSKPLLSPDDFQGITFQTFPSGAQQDAIRALGATPTTDASQRISVSSAVGGLESMWWTIAANSLTIGAHYVSGNVGLWPRTTVLFANPAALARLDPQAREWVNRAASDASDWSTIHAMDGQQHEVVQACHEQALIAMSSPEQLSALRAAAEPVYAELAADPGQRRTLEHVEQLVAAAEPDPPIEIPDGCAYHPGEPPDAFVSESSALTAAGSPGSLPPGVYRVNLTQDFLLSQGATGEEAFNNAGVWTWTIGNGEWHFKIEPIDASVGLLDCAGYYDARGNVASFTRVTSYSYGECAPIQWAATWCGTTDALTWSGLSIDDDLWDSIFVSQTWKKIS